MPPEWSHTCSYNYRYEKVLGTGSYGEVAKAVHTPTGQVVAIKKVKGVFQDRHDAREAHRVAQKPPALIGSALQRSRRLSKRRTLLHR